MKPNEFEKEFMLWVFGVFIGGCIGVPLLMVGVIKLLGWA